MIATLDELKLEQFLRNRNSGELIWVTKTGESIPLKDLTNEHLANIIKIKGRHSEKSTTISAKSLNFY